MHHPTDRITHTTAFVTPIVEHWLEREILDNFQIPHTFIYSGVEFLTGHNSFKKLVT